MPRTCGPRTPENRIHGSSSCRPAVDTISPLADPLLGETTTIHQVGWFTLIVRRHQRSKRALTCNFPKVFQYTFSRLVLWDRTNKQAIVCYRYANTQVLARADFVVITLKESTCHLHVNTVIRILINKDNFQFSEIALVTTYKLHCLLGIVLIAICDEGIASVLTREGVHH